MSCFNQNFILFQITLFTLSCFFLRTKYLVIGSIDYTTKRNVELN